MTDESGLVEMCMEHISTNLEELSFLRELADHLRLEAVSRGMEPLCETLLPTLRQAAGAERVAFLQATDFHGERKWSSVSESAEAEEAFDLSETVETLRDAVPVQPVFVFNRNGLSPQLENRIDPGIGSWVMAEVRQGEILYGWLVAVNRLKNAQRNLGHGFLISEHEFGTHEATLMSSIANLLATHARNLQLIEQKEELFLGIVRSMVRALDARDPYTCGHSERVANTAREIALEMRLSPSEVEAIHISGLLHDIGKIGIPDHVLLKPGRLSPEEFEIIKQHPSIGYNILSQISVLSAILPGVLHHHEAVNGSGYPQGLKRRRRFP